MPASDRIDFDSLAGNELGLRIEQGFGLLVGPCRPVHSFSHPIPWQRRGLARPLAGCRGWHYFRTGLRRALIQYL